MPNPVATTETSNNNTSTEQQTAREEVQKKYEEHYGASSEQPQVEQVSTTTEETTTATAQPTVEELLAKALSPLVDRLQAMETRIAESATPKAESKPAVADKKLIDYLREGDVDGFEQAMVDRVRAKVQPEVAQESVTEAVSRVRAESEIRNFVDKVQSENTDLAPMQSWIVAEASQILQASQDKIKSIDDYVTAYKDAVNKAIDTVRKAALTIRGSGKSEGMTTRREVLSSGVISPNSPNANAEANKQPDKQVESNTDYITRRQASHFASRGGAA